jgi:hypothetical protein
MDGWMDGWMDAGLDAGMGGWMDGQTYGQKIDETRHRWLMPIILVNQEVEVRRISVQSQHGQIVCDTYLKKKKSQKKAWWNGSRYRP